MLTSCDGRSGWPDRGVYFFMEDGECRTDSGDGLRVVRVGTHALTSSSRTTLWNRLSQHKGQKASGGGNHRGSIFRLLVGSTLLKTPGAACPTWGIKNSAPHDVRILEQPFEQEVSRITVRSMAPTSAACLIPPFMAGAHRDSSYRSRSAVRGAPLDGEPSDSGDRRNQDRALCAAVTPIRGTVDWDNAARISRPCAVLEGA